MTNIDIIVKKKWAWFPFGYTISSSVWETDRFEPLFESTITKWSRKRARQTAYLLKVALEYTYLDDSTIPFKDITNADK